MQTDQKGLLVNHHSANLDVPLLIYTVNTILEVEDEHTSATCGSGPRPIIVSHAGHTVI